LLFLYCLSVSLSLSLSLSPPFRSHFIQMDPVDTWRLACVLFVGCFWPSVQLAAGKVLTAQPMGMVVAVWPAGSASSASMSSSVSAHVAPLAVVERETVACLRPYACMGMAEGRWQDENTPPITSQHSSTVSNGTAHVAES
jgi:hypothetical protein